VQFHCTEHLAVSCVDQVNDLIITPSWDRDGQSSAVAPAGTGTSGVLLMAIS
jgi:hypothetical protein